MIDINELRRLAQEATPGPWVATTVVTSVGVCHKVGPFPGKTIEHPPRHACMYVDYDSANNPADCEIFANASFISAANPAVITELLDRLEAAEKDVALKERVIDALGSELNAVANERDALRTVLTDLLNDLEERAKWNLEESHRVVACGNGVYMRAKAALEETK